MIPNILLKIISVLVLEILISPFHVDVLVCGQVDFGNLQYIKSKVSPEIQTRAAQDVIERILPQRHQEFEVSVDPDLAESKDRDLFSIEWSESRGKILINGTSGTAALLGFNQYLKIECKCQIAWEGRQLNLPEVFPKVSIKKELFDRFRYYQNVCTDSYSFAWWNWKEWEKHIDWMSLNGINLPLAFTGQEAIWVRVWKSFGFTEKEIYDFLVGPAFLAWGRMGNIQLFGGPLPQGFVQGKLKLLHQILERERSLGMMPVLPCFAGFVLPAIKRVFPNINVTRVTPWGHFNKPYTSTYLLDPNEPLFIEIGKRFIQEMDKEIGLNHVYSCDTFNEQRPARNDSAYLKQISNITYQSMSSGDPKAVWLMQSWVFANVWWGKETVRAYLSGIPSGNAIVLDLQAELRPLYKPFEQFFNHSYIWCMLHDFGGSLGFYGAFSQIQKNLLDARTNWNSTLIGSGICPEGINQNYIVYDLFFDASLDPGGLHIGDWVKDFTVRRYGVNNTDLQRAWTTLTKEVYESKALWSWGGHALISRRPSLKLQEPIWYNLTDIQTSLSLLLRGRAGSPSMELYSNDLVDFSRQYLQVLGSLVYQRLTRAYSRKKRTRFEKTAHKLLELLDDLESVLETNENFLLGPWIRDAIRWGQSNEERDLLRWNALNQFTLWGYNGEIVDYATKQWAGIVSSYYRPRWSFFINALNSSDTFNWPKFRDDILKQVETPFTQLKTDFPVTPKGNALKEALRIYKKWSPIFNRLVKEHRIKGSRLLRRKGF